MANKKPKGYKKLKNDLITNLNARGLIEEMYTDKVNEYMDLWERRIQLAEDIKERGVMVNDPKRGLIENRSVSLEAQVSRQMLAIFTALGFKECATASKALPGGEDDEL